MPFELPCRMLEIVSRGIILGETCAGICEKVLMDQQTKEIFNYRPKSCRLSRCR